MNDLDQLKELLFGAEKEALDSIAERVERRDVRTTDVADVLPEAIHQSHVKDGELVDALAAPVGQCLQQEFKDDPQTYGDALYPVIGPAIRKSIMHALRNMTQQINEAVEHSISPKGLKWRWQASRAGIPYGEFVLQKTMRYRVEQAYLISRENGLLVGHVHHEASKIKDSDAVSAMFTAIQDFVKESFSPDRTGRLESADMGDFTLWAVHGPHALLVCVIRGVPPKSLRADLSAILERMHFRYGEAIRDYKGDTSTIPDVEVELERCLRFEARAEESGEKRSGPRLMTWIIIALLVAAAAYYGIRNWNYSQQLDQLNDALVVAPGIYVAETQRNGGQFLVRGLRDPLADDVSSIAAGFEIPADRLSIEMQSFQSLEPRILERRAAQLFGQPGTVRYSVAEDTLSVAGEAPWLWATQLEDKFSALGGVSYIDTEALVASDRTRFEEQAAILREKTFYFDNGTTLINDGEEQLRQHALSLRQLHDESGSVGYAVVVTVSSSTDSTGGRPVNETLLLQRADIGVDALNATGGALEIVRKMAVAEQSSDTGEDPTRRFVRISIDLR
ncbi:MAG: hypothetical protein ACR2QT_14295 [Woeseiaceae bacterium]